MHSPSRDPHARHRWPALVAGVCACVVGIAFGAAVAEGKSVAIDERLIRSLTEAHGRLRAMIQCRAGDVRYRRTALSAEAPESTQGEASRAWQARFAVCDGKARLAYIPSDNARPGAPPNEVLIQTPEKAFRYTAPPGPRSDYATLYQYSEPSAPAVSATIAAHLTRPLRALFQIGEVDVVDYLQRPGTYVTREPYGNVPEALWIRGREDMPMESSTFTVVLNPAYDFAIVYAEAQSTSELTTGRLTCNIEPAQDSSGSWFPGRVVSVASVERKDADPIRYREEFDFTIEPAKPLSDIFERTSFVSLGRSFSVLDVSADGSMRIVDSTQVEKPHWRNTTAPGDRSLAAGARHGVRVWLIAANAVLLLSAAIVLIVRRRRIAIRKSTSSGTPGACK